MFFCSKIMPWLFVQVMYQWFALDIAEQYSAMEGMATDPSILAWRISWREEPGGLQFMGLQRVGHNGVTEKQQTSTRPGLEEPQKHQQEGMPGAPAAQCGFSNQEVPGESPLCRLTLTQTWLPGGILPFEAMDRSLVFMKLNFRKGQSRKKEVAVRVKRFKDKILIFQKAKTDLN